LDVKLQFGPFTFDSRIRRLLRADADVHLTSKAFDLLNILLEDRPRAVRKSELRRRLWPDTFVSDENLYPLIREIRVALADDPKRPLIRTIPRFGYAFCGTVTSAPDELGVPAGPDIECWLTWMRQRLRLTGGENLVGRDPLCAVRIDSSGVSRRHARISITGADAILEDLSSKNGTYVGNVRIKAPTPLHDGDVIWFGSVLTTFRIWSPEGPTETAFHK
jgi:DNA-binding winged helix-turn-helix (wHTH) protein